MLVEGVRQRSAAREERIEQVALDHGADHLGRHDGWLRADNRHLRDAELSERVDRFADRLRRVCVDEGRQVTGLPAEHVADGAVTHGRTESVGGEPLVVEDLREVAAAAVGQEDNDHVSCGGPTRDVEGCDDRHPAGAAHQEPLLARETARHLEGVAVAHRDDLIRHLGVVGRRPEVFADSLDEVRATRAAGVDRSLGVGGDDAHLPVAGFLEVAPNAADGAARARTRDEVRHLATSLLPDLRARGLVVRARVVGVGVLIGLPRTGDLASEAVAHRVVGARIFGIDGRGALDHLGTVGAQDVLLVLGDLVRADEDTAVAALLGDDRQAYAGVAARRLDDRAARADEAIALGRLDHPRGNAVLHRTARIEVFHLGVNRTGDALGHAIEPHERGIADEIHDGVDDAHGTRA